MVVFGSVARGDFNVWSDLDVLVVAERLPDRWDDRLKMLWVDRPPRLSPLAWTPDELRSRYRRRDPIAVEAVERGVVMAGDTDPAVLVAQGRP